ncbi:hypothetical protein [Robbsia sp. KACC 23696]|uniref:hypothetical protein n=1 Tax=Robbsia sp. KACC 23696 TaxID=3149231 RepID=UPI00325B407E
MGLLSMGAHAATNDGLTPQECRTYPFVQTHHVSHHALMTELSELEAVGYQPTAEDPTYPAQLDVAEHRLHREYEADCANVDHR